MYSQIWGGSHKGLNYLLLTPRLISDVNRTIFDYLCKLKFPVPKTLFTGKKTDVFLTLFLQLIAGPNTGGILSIIIGLLSTNQIWVFSQVQKVLQWDHSMIWNIAILILTSILIRTNIEPQYRFRQEFYLKVDIHGMGTVSIWYTVSQGLGLWKARKKSWFTPKWSFCFDKRNPR